jgi:hypothetical protein
MDIIFWSGLPNDRKLVQRYIGPYQLGHWLEKNGHTYQVIDFIMREHSKMMSVDQLFALTEQFITPATRAIGLSTTFFGHVYGQDIAPNAKVVIQQIRKKYPHIKFILGGNNAENTGPDATRLFDAVIIGLAEDVLVQLLDYYTGQGDEPVSRRPVLHKPKFYYGDDVVDPKFNIQHNDHQWADKDIIMPNEVLPLEVSRGCIFHCKFCQYPLLGRSKYDYTRNMDLLKQELLKNYDLYGTTNYYLLDDTFNDTPQKVKEFHTMATSLPFQLRWTGYIRADLLDRFPETIQLVKETGIAGAFFGIESFGKEAALAVGKGWSYQKAQNFLPELVHRHWNDEVSVHISMIAGLPGDTEESLNASVDWFQANDLHVFNFKPLWVLKHNSNKIFSSIFSKEAANYGYEFPYSDAPANWLNTKTGWTYLRAMNVAANLNARRDPVLHREDVWDKVPRLTTQNDDAWHQEYIKRLETHGKRYMSNMF